MRLPSTWFPTNWPEIAGWFLNFTAQANASGLTYGLTAAEVTQLGNDNQVIQFLADAMVTIKAYDDAVRQYRKIITEGDIGDPTPAFPVNMDLTLPVVIPTGIYERVNDYAIRIRGSAPYTDETGALYGILPSASEGFNPATEVVSIDATVDPGNVVNVTFVRGKSDGVRVEIAIDKGPWTSEGNFMRSPVVIEIPQNEDELPRSVQIRARYLDGNTPVGDWSDVVTVQTIP